MKEEVFRRVRHPRFLPGLAGARSSLTVPLKLHDRVIGTFNIESQQVGAFTEDDRQFAEQWARYLRQSASPASAIALARMNTQIDIRHVLPAIRVPTLALYRTGDRVAPIDEARFFPADRRQEKAREFLAGGKVRVESCTPVETRKLRNLPTPEGRVMREIIYRDWQVSGSVGREPHVELVLNEREQVLFGRCGCEFFQEDFSDLSANTWWSAYGDWYFQDEKLNLDAIESGKMAHAKTYFFPGDFFDIDVDVEKVALPEGGAYSIYPFTTGTVFFEADGKTLEGVGAILYESGNAYLIGADVVENTWYKSAKYPTTGPVTSIGVAYSSDDVTLRINRQNTSLKLSGNFASSYLLIDTLWLMAQGDGTRLRFDNVCAGLLDAPPPPPALQAPRNLRYALNGSLLTISWDPATGAAGYILDAGLQPGNYTFGSFDMGDITQVGPFEVSSVAPPGTYYVGARAYNGSQESAHSNEIAITVTGRAGELSISPSSDPLTVSGTYNLNGASTPLQFSSTSEGNGKAKASYRLGDGSAEVTVDLQGGDKGTIVWKGITIDGYGPLTPQEEAAIRELASGDLGTALALTPLDLGCLAKDKDPAALAALLMPWQMVLKYAVPNRTEKMQALAQGSACSYYENLAGSKPSPGLVLLSNEDPVPYVYEYFPFDEEGAVEASSSSSSSLLAAELPVVDGRLFGPCGSRCRGACGPDCPDTCAKSDEKSCLKDDDGNNTGAFTLFKVYKCGGHAGCEWHDNCFEECLNKYGCGTWSASVELSVPAWLEGRGKGWVTAEYNMLPGSTSPRKKRDRMQQDGRTTEIQRLIGRSLRSVVDMAALGPRTIKALGASSAQTARTPASTHNSKTSRRICRRICFFPAPRCILMAISPVR